MRSQRRAGPQRRVTCHRTGSLHPRRRHTFAVFNAANGAQEICSFTTDGTGAAGCSAQDLELKGFGMARILDGNDAIVASGAFARRGNCRDAGQVDSQCESNATRQNV